ncbi:MAG: tetratricopeptide repeat protein [Candidatus Marinimicrobia bacterium]|nr:tetratricopeptide repeat protein [Candidatus Neomarinimicrobiota bacterium]
MLNINLIKILFIISIIYSGAIFAQEKKINISKNPILNQLQSLDSLANAKLNNDSFEALKVANDGLLLAVENNNLRYQSGFQSIIGHVMSNIALWDKAIEHYLLALELEIQKGDSSGMAWQTMSIGTVYLRQDRYDTALNKYKEAFELFKQINDHYGMAVSLHNQGHTNDKLEKYDISKENYFAAKDHCVESGDDRIIAYNLMLIASAYEKLEMYDIAIQTLNESTDIYTEIQDQYLIYSNYLMLTDIWLSIGNVDSTLHYLKQTGAKLNHSRFFRELPRFYMFQARFYKDLKQYDEALLNLDKGIKSAEKNNFNNSKHDLMKLKIEIHKILGNHDVLLELYPKIIELKNKLHTLRIDLNVTKSEYQILQYEKDKELLVKEFEIEKQKSIRKFYTIVSILSLIILIGLIYRYFHMKRTAQELLEKSQKIHQLETEKLDTEIHFKEKQLMTKAMNSAQNREWLIELAKDLEHSRDPKQIVRKTTQNIREKLSSFDDWNEFESWFLEIHQDFFDTLNKSFPELTQREIQICAFLKLNMVTKDIANLTNLTVASVDVYRSKIRKIMNLSPEDNLVKYIQNIV